MLKNIPAIISPDLLHALSSMGHGEEILFADADFPAGSCRAKIIRMDGLLIEDLLEAVLPFFPLDSFVEHPVITMDCSQWGPEPESYERYRKVIRKTEENFTDFEFLERFAFYEQASKSSVIVVTSEPDGNVILKKGPVM